MEEIAKAIGFFEQEYPSDLGAYNVNPVRQEQIDHFNRLQRNSHFQITLLSVGMFDRVRGSKGT